MCVCVCVCVCLVNSHIYLHPVPGVGRGRVYTSQGTPGFNLRPPLKCESGLLGGSGVRLRKWRQVSAAGVGDIGPFHWPFTSFSLNFRVGPLEHFHWKCVRIFTWNKATETLLLCFERYLANYRIILSVIKLQCIFNLCLFKKRLFILCLSSELHFYFRIYCF